MTKPDFSKIFAQNGAIAALTDSQFLQGLEYLGDNPPTKEEFNWLFQQFCLKLQYLDSQGTKFFRQNTHTYAVGDKAYSPTLPSYAYLECIVAGTTASAEPVWPAVGSTIEDEAVTWAVRDMRVADDSDDNSTKLSTTAWIRNNIQSLVSGCIGAVATAAGFSYNLAANGYIKLPSWLSGLMMQWGKTASMGLNTSLVVTLPIAFPTAALMANATVIGANTQTTATVTTITQTQITLYNDDVEAGGGSTNSIYYLTIGY